VVIHEAANASDLSREIELRVALRKASLGAFAIGNVLNYGDEIVDTSVRLSHAADAEICPDNPAILAGIALFNAIALGFADEYLVEHRDIGCKIVRISELLECSPR
jgi:hypothetical protein